MVLNKSNSNSLMDISKIFSLLQPKEEEDSNYCQQLNQAAFTDDVKRLTELLSQDQYKRCINQRSGWGIPVTPLRTAAAQGHLHCLQVLLANGAEVDSLDVKAQTPLFMAVSAKHLDCVAALLKAGADPNGSPHNNCSPVLTAAREGDVAILRELLSHGAEVDVKPKIPDWASNATACRGPLYISAVYGHMDCSRLLLQHGANPDYNCTEEKMLSQIKQPKTVMEMCLRNDSGPEYIQLLIDFGANVYLPSIIMDNTTRQKESVMLLLKERVCPKTLMSQARISIRRFLPMANKMCSIESLNIPQILKNYLNHIS
ncbi:ankyrin repeat and SOCS box protein 12b [Triplophysa dalaica]|uniref:ankyrin repeat and SOCS box protein 12b n=1 Tax=Triplophysa dalaica TaxID=1582913 RepID=UPI0024DFD164|nr:ankyrin repeat and SOCS box protein 12b [Triplophysa dalaica]XP_056626074.1 ankyrin repeat and SOCS box protein 12b [Triplophysa dalaica]